MDDGRRRLLLRRSYAAINMSWITRAAFDYDDDAASPDELWARLLIAKLKAAGFIYIGTYVQGPRGETKGIRVLKNKYVFSLTSHNEKFVVVYSALNSNAPGVSGVKKVIATLPETIDYLQAITS